MQTSMLVLGIESILIIVVAIGWIIGARRMNYNLHHIAVYSVILVHAIIVAIWMIPRAMVLVDLGMLDNPIANLQYLAHYGIGLIADFLSIFLALLFIWKRDIPLNILKKARPIMILTLALWVITFATGVYNMFF